MAEERHVAYIGLGSNLGDRVDYLERAIKEIEKMGVQVSKTSSLYESEPVGYLDQGWFINQVAEVVTELEPLILLRVLQSVENDLGRVRVIRWGPRVIDLDLLLYDDLMMETSELTIPHPSLYQRNFVLIPLQEIAPDLIHPDGRTTAQHLWEYLGTKPKERIWRLSPPLEGLGR